MKIENHSKIESEPLELDEKATKAMSVARAQALERIRSRHGGIE